MLLSPFRLTPALFCQVEEKHMLCGRFAGASVVLSAPKVTEWRLVLLQRVGFLGSSKGKLGAEFGGSLYLQRFPRRGGEYKLLAFSSLLPLLSEFLAFRQSKGKPGGFPELPDVPQPLKLLFRICNRSTAAVFTFVQPGVMRILLLRVRQQ